jgi:tetratricopeptide (TPR) repeat protein
MLQNLRYALRQLARSTGFTAVVLAGLLAGTFRARAADAPTDATPLVVARKLFQAGKYPEARTALAMIAATEPVNAEAIFYLGWTAFRQNENEEAMKLLEQATALDATKSLYFHVLGDTYSIAVQRASIFSKLGWARKCLAAYDRGVALDPDNLDVRRARCEFYRNAPAIAGGGMDKAYAEAGEIRKRDPLRGAQILGDLYVSEKKYPEAFALLDDVIAKNPDNKTLLYQVGRLAAISGQQLDRGEAALRDYLQYTPTANDPALYNAHWRLGALFERKGNKAAARAEYEAALKLSPDYRPAQDALKKL